MLHFYPQGREDGGAPSADTVWIDALKPTDAERALIEDHTGLRLPTPEDLAAIDRSSQLIVDGETFRLSSPVVAEADSDHPRLSHMGLILTPKLLISIRYDSLKVFEAAAERAPPDDGPESSAMLFTALLEAVVDRQADLLERARQHLDEISHGVFRSSPSEVRRVVRSNEQLRVMLRRIGRIGERVSLIRDSMLGVGRIAPFVREAGKGWIAPELQDRLTAVSQDIDSLNLFEEHLSGKVQFLLDAVVGFIGIEQNDIFKVLTIASVVGIFPTLVAGWYGMNFHNMPEYGWTYGYQFGIGMILLSTILPLLWFKWRGWL
jgi:magnesium transporter